MDENMQVGLIKELLENHSLKFYSIEVLRPNIGPKNPHRYRQNQILNQKPKLVPKTEKKISVLVPLVTIQVLGTGTYSQEPVESRTDPPSLISLLDYYPPKQILNTDSHEQTTRVLTALNRIEFATGNSTKTLKFPVFVTETDR